MPDMFEMLFRKQEQLMERWHTVELEGGSAVVDVEMHGNLDDRQVQRRLRELAGFTTEELYEAINNLKNKPWKLKDRPTDVSAFYEELADAWHFLIELTITAGLDAQDMFRHYVAKEQINHQRMDDGV